MKPSFYLHDIFGSGYMFSGRYPYGAGPSPADRMNQDAASGGLLGVAGSIQVLAHQRVADPACLSLLKKAGLEIPEKLILYHDKESYINLLDSLNGSSQKMAFNFPHRSPEYEEGNCIVKPSLLAS